MKGLALAGLAAAMAAGAMAGTPTGFTDDYDAALKAAATSGRKVLAVFSGSDWCVWCQRLETEVLTKPEFVAGATNRFVLLYLDLPNDKSRVSAKAAKRNPDLAEKYQVEGFPTVLVLDAKGAVQLQTGYQEGGPVKYLEMLAERVKTEPLVVQHLNPYRTELEALSQELMAEAMKGAKRDGDPTAQFKARLRELKPKYAGRIERMAERLKGAKIPEEIEPERLKLLQGISQMERMFAWAEIGETDYTGLQWMKEWSENVRTNRTLETCAGFRERALRPFLLREMDPAGKATADERRLLNAAVDAVWGEGGFKSFGDRKRLVETLDRLAKKPFAAMVRAFVAKKDFEPKAVAWLEDGRFTGEDLRAVFWTFRNDINYTNARFCELLGKSSADDWLKAVWRIGVARNAAWKARGGGYANSVSKEGWDGFAKGGDACRAAYQEAMKLRPYPEPAYFFITLGPFSEDVFRTVTAAQLDFPFLYRHFLWYNCFPRWCGSHPKMKAFAECCYATKRHDTMIPFHYAETIFRMLRDMNLTPEAYFAKHPAELDKIIEVAVPQLSGTNTIGFVRQCAGAYASIAYCLKGDYARAAETFRSFEHRTFPNSIWGYIDNFSHWWMILDGISGRNRAEFQRLHRLFVAEDYRGFLAGLAELRKRVKFDGNEETYAEEQTLAARVKTDFAEGKPLVAMFPKNKRAWLTYGGAWQMNGDYAFRAGGYNSGNSLAWDVAMPGEFRMECEIAPNGKGEAWQFEFYQNPDDPAVTSHPYLALKFAKGKCTVAFGEWRAVYKNDTAEKAEFPYAGGSVRLAVEYRAGKVAVFVNGAAQPALETAAFANVLNRVKQGRLRFNGADARLTAMQVRKP